MTMTFETVTSRSGHLIPIVNGYHIHSIYNPIKEAKSFIEANLKKVAGEKNFLVFGGGYGYHINELVNYLETNERKDFCIYVIEPNNDLKSFCVQNNPFPNQIIYLENVSPEVAFNNQEFVNFLVKKPALLIHQASFNVYKEFYESFLKFKSSRNVADLIGAIASNEFKSALTEYNSLSIDEAISESTKTTSANFHHFLISTFANVAGNREDQA